MNINSKKSHTTFKGGIFLSKVLNNKQLVLGILLGLFLTIIIFVCVLASKTYDNKEDNWIIQSVDDTVVLINNGQVVEVFSEISIDMLPKEDKLHLEKGIVFLSKDEAMTAIEDYDG